MATQEDHNKFIAARIDAGLAEVRAELYAAMTKHPNMHSPHEGHSVIREELEELWEHVRADTGQTAKARKEAIQISAMGLRYVLDLCPAAEPKHWMDRREPSGDQFGGFRDRIDFETRSAVPLRRADDDGFGLHEEAEPADRGVSSRERAILRISPAYVPSAECKTRADGSPLICKAGPCEHDRAGPPTPRAESSAESNNCDQEEGA